MKLKMTIGVQRAKKERIIEMKKKKCKETMSTVRFLHICKNLAALTMKSRDRIENWYFKLSRVFYFYLSSLDGVKYKIL